MDNNDKWTQGMKPQTHCEELPWADARCVVSIADSYPRFLLFLHIDNVCTGWHANEIFWFEAEHCNCFFHFLRKQTMISRLTWKLIFHDILFPLHLVVAKLPFSTRAIPRCPGAPMHIIHTIFKAYEVPREVGKRKKLCGTLTHTAEHFSFTELQL